jgi:hypothetical protein
VIQRSGTPCASETTLRSNGLVAPCTLGSQIAAYAGSRGTTFRRSLSANQVPPFWPIGYIRRFLLTPWSKRSALEKGSPTDNMLSLRFLSLAASWELVSNLTLRVEQTDRAWYRMTHSGSCGPSRLRRLYPLKQRLFSKSSFSNGLRDDRHSPLCYQENPGMDQLFYD